MSACLYSSAYTAQQVFLANILCTHTRINLRSATNKFIAKYKIYERVPIFIYAAQQISSAHTMIACPYSSTQRYKYLSKSTMNAYTY